ncbi:DEAD-box ATP-dependent RNA helicase 50, partial [Morus notabilis]|uniref:DEAD-box ATP-dependent RNA helicase 50 n=1 Tax=Morus notabilis TaxID=981085 RepID=UPI000CED1636
MLGKAHSPLLNLDLNPSIIHHGPTTSFPLSLNLWNLGTQRFGSSSSCSCKSMAIDFEKSEDSHHKPQPPDAVAGTPTIVRSTTSFGRLKVQRAKIPRFVERQEQDEHLPLAFDDESVDVGSNAGVELVKGAGVSSHSRWQRSGDKSSETRKHSSAKAPAPRRWNLRHDSLDLTQRSKSTSGAADFFSRKSFRDVGCSDFMIECLRKLNFQRPSNIQ